MTDTTPHPQDELLAIAQADALLDMLGRGEPVDEDDNIAALLAAWRADLAAEPAQTSTIRVAYPAAPGADPDPTPGSARRRTVRRFTPTSRRARIAVAAAGIAAVMGGIAAVAATATPGSPLWSISRVIYPQRADRVAAEDALSRARQDINDRDFPRARNALDQAASLISQVHDPRQAARLQAELEQLRQLLVTSTTGIPLPTPSAGPTPQPSSSPDRKGQPPGVSTGGPGSLLPSPHPSSGTHSSPGSSPTSGLLPTVPPLPTLLPSLPIHIGG